MHRYTRRFVISLFLVSGIVLTVAVLTPSVSTAQDDRETANKQAILRIVEQGFNQGNVAVLDEVVAPDYISYPPGGAEPTGLAEFKEDIETFRAAMPDLHATADPLIAEGDWVAFRFTMTGTFQNELVFGDGEVFPPTGEPFTFTINILARFNEQGQLVEEWDEADSLSLFTQLGMLSPDMFGPSGEGGEMGAMLDGEALVSERCTVCHTRDRIDAADKDEAGWTTTVDRMISNGAQLTAEERAAVIAYLVETH